MATARLGLARTGRRVETTFIAIGFAATVLATVDLFRFFVGVRARRFEANTTDKTIIADSRILSDNASPLFEKYSRVLGLNYFAATYELRQQLFPRNLSAGGAAGLSAVLDPALRQIRIRSFAGERRRAFFQEVRDALAKILGGHAGAHLLDRQCERLAQVLVECAIDLPLHNGQRSGRNGFGQLARGSVDPRGEILFGENARYQTDAQSFAGVDHLRGKGELDCIAQPDQTRQHPRETVFRHQTAAGKDHGEAGVFAGKTKIAVKRHDEAEADARSMDRGDDRLGHGKKPGVFVAKPGGRPGRTLDGEILRGGAVARCHLGKKAEIRAGAESFARAGQDDGANGIVGRGGLDRGSYLAFHPARPGVQLAGAIQGDGRDAVRYFVCDLFVVGHGNVARAYLAATAVNSASFSSASFLTRSMDSSLIRS